MKNNNNKRFSKKSKTYRRSIFLKNASNSFILNLKNKILLDSKKKSKTTFNIKSKISQFIQSFDLYEKSPIIFFDKNQKFKTEFGGFIFSIILLIFLFFFILLFRELNEKSTFYIVENNIILKNPPSFNFTMKPDLINIYNKPLFSFALRFKVNKKIVPIEEIKKFISFKIVLNQITFSKNDRKFIDSFNLISCEYTFLNVLKFIGKNYDELTNIYCLDKSDTINLQGSNIIYPFTYLSIEFRKCFNNKDIKCETNENLINEFLDYLLIEFLYTSSAFDETNIRDYPVSHHLLSSAISIRKKFYLKKDVFLQYNYFKSLNNFYDRISEAGENKRYIKVDEIKNSIADIKDRYLTIYIRSSKETHFTVRYYRDFLKFLSQIGGIGKFMIIIGGFLVSMINKKLLMIRIANKIMTIIIDNKKAKSKRNSNDLNSSKVITNYPNYMNLSKSKSKIEEEIFISAYESQKNSGFHINSFEIFINILKKTFFFFSKKKNTKQTNFNKNPIGGNLTIRRRNSILKKFSFNGKLTVETQNLYELILKQVISKLDFIKIINFSREKTSLINIFFGKIKFLICNTNKVPINFESLLKVNQEDKKKILNIYHPDLDKVELKFLKGIRYLRNKPITHPKIDVKLLNRFCIDQRYIREYFNENKFNI